MIKIRKNKKRVINNYKTAAEELEVKPVVVKEVKTPIKKTKVYLK